MVLFVCMICFYIHCTCRLIYYLHNHCCYKLLIRFILSLHFLHCCLLISDKLSTRSDSDLFINLRLSMNFSFNVINLPSLFSFFISTVNVRYFSVSSPKHVMPSITFAMVCMNCLFLILLC